MGDKRRGHGWALVTCALLSAWVARSPDLQAAEAYVLHGTVVTPSETIIDGRVFVQDGFIRGVGTSVNAPTGIPVVDVHGVIFPGFIDLHDHLTWNVLPRWEPGRTFLNRYDWQESPAYAQRLSGPYYALTASNDLACAMSRYAEVKALVNGATSVVGSLANKVINGCLRGLVRNLDFLSGLESDGPNRELLRNHIFPLELSAAEEEELRTIDPGSTALPKIRAAVLHVAEGADASSRREFRMLLRQDLLRKGVSIVHGVGLLPEHLQVLAEKGVGLVWSLRSNLELYGKTVDIVSARNAKLTIAIAPDWSPTGSAGMLPELRLVNTYNRGALSNTFGELELISMATRNPAALAGLAQQIGTIAVGLRADLLVMRDSGGPPLQAALRSTPSDVRLVVVGGQPLYGDPELLTQLAAPNTLESLSVCGVAKALAKPASQAEGQTLEEIERLLQKAVASVGTTLAPLVECP